MKNIAIILFILIVSSGVVGSFVWNYVNKPATDLSNTAPSKEYSFADLMMLANDSLEFKKSISQFVAVQGQIKNMVVDSTSTTLELGDSTDMSSLICQVDSRHQGEFKEVKIGDVVSVKGKITGVETDTDLGLGNTVQMNFCSKHKKE